MNQVTSFANRGMALEELIAAANWSYRQKKIAVIHKVPSEWLPIRNRSGKIISAKITKKAAVDYNNVAESPRF
jgi:recombination protein U